MTITTTVTISHDELHDLHLTDDDFRKMGYSLKHTSNNGKTYVKTQWQTCKGENSLLDEL